MSAFKLSESHPLRIAHRQSANHKKAVLKSKQCGCFYCLSLFPPSKIQEWIDEGTTALCPSCGIDSVIGDASVVHFDKDFLKAMNATWF